MLKYCTWSRIPKITKGYISILNDQHSHEQTEPGEEFHEQNFLRFASDSPEAPRHEAPARRPRWLSCGQAT